LQKLTKLETVQIVLIALGISCITFALGGVYLYQTTHSPPYNHFLDDAWWLFGFAILGPFLIWIGADIKFFKSLREKGV
jgi:hypothetical protein